MAGYSGTPLVRKLGIKPGMRVAVVACPLPYAQLVPDLPGDVVLADDPGERADLVHVFVTGSQQLEQLPRLGRAVHPHGTIWVSWPKKSAKLATDVTEDVVRRAALAAGLVDVKVCAVDGTWSGLKLVYRLKDR